MSEYKARCAVTPEVFHVPYHKLEIYFFNHASQSRYVNGAAQSGLS